MSNLDGVWYHGSPERLTHLHIGSTITQDRDLARIFSHKPSRVSQDFDAAGQRCIRHNGQRPGFLYRIAEELTDSDIYRHPQSTMGPDQEWLTTRELRVEFIELTKTRASESLSEADIEALQQRAAVSDRQGY